MRKSRSSLCNISFQLKGSAHKNDVMNADLSKKIILFCGVQVKGVPNCFVADTGQV